MKIYITESFHTQVIKGSIEIDQAQFKELDGMTEDQIQEYISRYSEEMYLTEEHEEEGWSLYDELMEQDVVKEKEKNYETNVYIDKD